MRTEADNVAASDSSSGGMRTETLIGAATGDVAAETQADERTEIGSQSTDQNASVLHPDVTFGASPFAHILHVVAFLVCMLVSIGSMIAQLPLQQNSTAWWPVLGPQLVFPVISIAFHAYSILPRVQRRALRMQLSETPNPSTTNNGSLLQHSVLERVFRKTYVASNCSDIALYASILAAIGVLFFQLQSGRGAEGNLISWKMVGLPIALGGLAAVIIQTLYRVRNRGAFPTISTRSDFAVIFVFLAAYKLDRDSLSWTITFIFLFWWIIAFVLLGLAGLIVYHAGRRAHLWTRTDLNVRLAVSLVHISYVLLLVASVFFFKLLRGGGPQEKPYSLSAAEGSRLFKICLSMTAAWVMASSVAQIAVFRGQKKREEEREVQIAEGRVWTQGATLHNEMATIVRQVDALSPEEIVKKASELMQGVNKPARLYRLDANLWSTSPKPDTATAATSTPDAVVDSNHASSDDPTGAEEATAVESAEAEATHAGPSHASGGASPCAHSGEVAVNIPLQSKTDLPINRHSDSSGGSQAADPDKADTSCVICFEEVGDHVMMPCGHGGYCRHCAHKLYVRPPNLCPICRSRLNSVVKVSLDTKIGTYTGVL